MWEAFDGMLWRVYVCMIIITHTTSTFYWSSACQDGLAQVLRARYQRARCHIIELKIKKKTSRYRLNTSQFFVFDKNYGTWVSIPLYAQCGSDAHLHDRLLLSERLGTAAPLGGVAPEGNAAMLPKWKNLLLGSRWTTGWTRKFKFKHFSDFVEISWYVCVVVILLLRGEVVKLTPCTPRGKLVGLRSDFTASVLVTEWLYWDLTWRARVLYDAGGDSGNY